ncbi:MAG: RHS repeat-associated core domain-containing protein, partial [Candidatus Parabeggiatoa sp.]|nr:RHS repeat-associated core domain-containing protein [Candidatus Parabeggiatoa sp.]
LLTASLDSYFAANEVYDTWQAKMSDVVAHRAPSMGSARTVLTTDFVVRIPQKVEFNGIAFEIERLNSQAVGKNNTQRFQRQIGKLGSALAHLVLEQTFGQGNQAVSALRALASALKSGERIDTLNPETAKTVLPELSLDASPQNFIDQALHLGMHVTLPENSITLDTWTGRGLGSVSPETGNSHYPTFGTGGQATGILYNDIGQRLVWASLLKNPVRLAPAIKPQIPVVQSVAVGLIPLATDPLKIGLTDKVLTLLTGSQIEQETGPSLPEVLDEHLFSGLLLEHLSLGQLLDPVPPEISLQLAADSINPGENLQITATASDNGEITSLTVKINDQVLPLDDNGQASFTSDQPGKYTLVVTATDRAGNISRQENSFRVNAPDDTSPPELVIHSPEDGTEITAPTDFVATIADDSLVSWQLAVKSVSNPGLTILGSGSDPIANQPIATFDPTMLTNGLYQVIFQAVDANGRSTGISKTYRVAGDLKVGNFSFTVKDISIDMMGLPLKVLRTYDTRRKGEALDFGQGWSINYQDIKVEESRVPGQHWTLNTYGRRFNQLFCVESLGSPPQITVTFPDGKVEAFEVGVQPRCQSVFQGRPTHLNMVFKPLSGTFSKLEVLDAYAENVYFDGRALLELLNEGRSFNPSFYRLTTQNGYQYDIQQDDIEAQQTPGLKKITEPNGNTLTYTDDGIIHSAGKSILFTRDNQGRITAITDPKGNSLKYQYNLTGDLIASTDFLGNSVRYTYNSTHAMTDIQDPLGRKVVRNLYNDDGRVTGQIDSEGNRTNFNHNLKGRQSLVTDKLGRVTQLYYDGRGNVITRVDPLGNIRYSTYDQFGNQLSAIDPLGNATFFKYDDKFNLLEQKDAEGNVVKYTYTEQSKEKTLTDARGNTFENFYDNQGNLIKIKDPKGHEISIMLEKGLITSVRDTNDNVTKFTYDKSGNKLTETDPLGNTVTFTYDSNGNELSYSSKRTDASGSQVVETTFYEYDKRKRLIQTTDAFGNKTKTEYNTLGQEVAYIDANGRRTDYKYDTYSNLAEIRYPDGTKETRNYDVEGNLLSVTNVAGQTTRYEYDKLDRQIKVIYSDGSVSQTQYDAAGRKVAQLDENSNRTEFKYDKVGRRIQTKNALGQITSNAYDADGNLVSKTDNNGNTIAYQYSALDQRIKTIYPGNLVEEDIYDKVGNLVREKDLAGNETQYQYDKLSRLTEVIKSLSDKAISTTFGYDEVGNRISQTDANQNTTTWTYDKLGRVISRTLPLGMTETFAYDKKTGNLLSHTNFNGKSTTFSYDQNTDRLLSTTYADGSIESFTYDVSGNRLLMKAENGTTSYSYDNFHRLIKEVKPNQAVLEYGYDKLSNRTLLKFTEPSGTAAQVQYQYDALSRLQKVIAPDGETVYLYDSVGNLSQVIYPNGTYTQYAYDKLNRLTALETLLPDNSLLASYQYTLTPTGQRSQIVEHTGRVINYTYDDLYRLKFEKISTADNDVVFSYQYDAVGNRVYSIEDGVHTKYTYDTNDRLLKQGGVVYQYDANGNTRSITEEDQVVQMSYDGDDRLISVVTEEKGQVTSTVSYGYDADGNRVQTSLNGEVTQYVVDSNDSLAQVIAELDKDDQVKVAYLHGDDLISQYRGNDIHYYHYDGLGSTRGLTDQNAVVTDAYNYEAFGKLLEQTGETENNYLYTGEQIDPNTGNYYLRSRYYNPASGRFLSMDSFNGVRQSPIT